MTPHLTFEPVRFDPERVPNAHQQASNAATYQCPTNPPMNHQASENADNPDCEGSKRMELGRSVQEVNV
jgi:hypothetical protein